MGALLEAQVQKVDLALVPGALRTGRALDKIREYLPVADAQIECVLYTADAPELIGIAMKPNAQTLLIVGHEPTISEAGYFLGNGPVKERLHRGVRTATAFIIEIPDASRSLIGTKLSVETLYTLTHL